MPFAKNTEFAERVGQVYGEYESTFISDHGQVHAELFRRGDKLVAFISFLEGYHIQDVTDKYVSALERHAAELGFSGKLQLLFPES